jgi:hypothetical protein
MPRRTPARTEAAGRVCVATLERDLPAVLDAIADAAARVVELHEGRVAVESAIGQGSTFTVSLPVHQEIRG